MHLQTSDQAELKLGFGGQGTGLAVVNGTVKQMGGHVSVESKPGAGSAITVCVPAIENEKVETEPDTAPRTACPALTILVCEDENMVRGVMCETLRAADYTVIEAGNGQQALEVAAAYGGTIDLLISDIVMPGMNGRELAASLALDHPGMRVLFVSGYAADHFEADGMGDDGAGFLQKPFGLAVLLRRVREIFETGNVKG